MALRFPFFTAIVSAMRSPPSWAARGSVAHCELEAGAFVAPELILGALGEVAMIARATPQRIAIVRFSVRRVTNDLRSGRASELLLRSRHRRVRVRRWPRHSVVRCQDTSTM
eukprot:365641-Pyramimonas_sp.AAC.1